MVVIYWPVAVVKMVVCRTKWKAFAHQRCEAIVHSFNNKTDTFNVSVVAEWGHGCVLSPFAPVILTLLNLIYIYTNDHRKYGWYYWKCDSLSGVIKM